MSLKDLCLKKAFSSDSDDILHEFYIPTLAQCNQYKRLAGFFSSTALAIAARGIAALIKNNGVMMLIASPRLRRQDLDVLIASHRDPEEFLEQRLLDDLSELENEFVRDHVRALGWMTATQRLEIRLAIPQDEYGNPMSYEESQHSGMFHQKVGILEDSSGNTLTFSGSVNESATGWLDNIEEFKVFRSWEASEKEYVDADISKFTMFWNNASKRVRVVRLPRAVEEKLIEIAPDSIDHINLGKWYTMSSATSTRQKQLFEHQKAAIDAWIKNDMRGILEMATGTGKTLTALGCLEKASEVYPSLIVVVACPYHHLVQQWKVEIEGFFGRVETLVADSTNPSWKTKLADMLIDISMGSKDRAIVLTTHRTFSSRHFREILRSSRCHTTTFVIGDEVHGLGATESRLGLIDEYRLRLGLSATPKRWFDSAGTDTLYTYFGDTVFEFGLREAISSINPNTGLTYLTPYRYIPRFVSLTAQELNRYAEKTRLIVSRFNSAKDDSEKKAILDTIIFQRADIIKNAVEKYSTLENTLDKIGRNIRWTIIYCSPEQIDNVMEILKVRGVIAHRFTMEEGTKQETKYGGMSERDFILNRFAEGKYQVLVAMKCLDEGVDVPPARIAILMASSGNPREYVQRIGRVIRRHPGKTEATIYDLIVMPGLAGVSPELWNIEQRISSKELDRYEEIAGISINNAEALQTVYNLRNRNRQR